MSLVGPVSPCHRPYVGQKVFLEDILWVQYIISWLFGGFKILFRGYSVGLTFFLVGISLVQDFFLWVFGESKIFSRAWVQNFMIFNRLQ